MGLNLLIRRLGEEAPAFFSIAAERFVDRIEAVGDTELGIIQAEIVARPERWLHSLRGVVDEGRNAAAVVSRLLDVVGEDEDVLRLRRFSRKSKPRVDPMLGKQLARRLAHRVQIEDHGQLPFGSAIGTSKELPYDEGANPPVLSDHRSRFAATRDEVLETLLPDAEPTVALNSLNQTVYFLRRVFEPEYRDDTSPGTFGTNRTSSGSIADLLLLEAKSVPITSRDCQSIPAPTRSETSFPNTKGLSPWISPTRIGPFPIERRSSPRSCK